MLSVFDIEPKITINTGASYIISYPYLIEFFAPRPSFRAIDLVAGAHMVYGWMPTILDLYPHENQLSLEAGADLLTKAKLTGYLDNDEISTLARLVNNSFVSASKLLHFVAPDNFAIWDSKVYRFLYGQAPYTARVNNVHKYREYLDHLSRVILDPRFFAFHTSVNQKTGYVVSAFRAIELVMFLGGSETGAKDRFKPNSIRELV